MELKRKASEHAVVLSTKRQKNELTAYGSGSGDAVIESVSENRRFSIIAHRSC